LGKSYRDYILHIPPFQRENGMRGDSQKGVLEKENPKRHFRIRLGGHLKYRKNRVFISLIHLLGKINFFFKNLKIFIKKQFCRPSLNFLFVFWILVFSLLPKKPTDKNRNDEFFCIIKNESI